MRFRFPSTDPAEAALHALALDQMDAWWTVFAAHAEALARHFDEGEELDVVALMDALSMVDPRLCWEFGPGVRDGAHRLVITPEFERQLRPMVDVLLARAPHIPGWEFHPARLAEPFARVNAVVEDRTGVSLEGWRAGITANEELGIDLTFWSPARGALDDDAANDFVLTAAEVLLGAQRVDAFVDELALSSAPPPGSRDVPLAELANDFERLLPPPAARGDAWSVLAVEGVPSRVLTSLVPMWRRAHSGKPFASERFSRRGEIFCSLESRSGLAGTQTSVERALRESQLGSVIGGGEGHLDLALLDVERALPELRRALGEKTRGTWLGFFDSALADEWIGLHDDTTPPPGRFSPAARAARC